ncbi:AmmeMemoRadiSam system protein B [Pseudoscardovia suis]|uniref:AmmeMemoRadiSam system protein B n=1 Tax=Pseudoscardovia suis TaxID=987063 RepID=UPI003F9B2757
MTFQHSNHSDFPNHSDSPNHSGLDDASAYVRPAAVAGAFYTADPERLRQWVDDALAQAQAQVAHLSETGIIPRDVPKAVIVPHAGHRYSGRKAALAFALLARGRGQIRRVVIAGPTHRVAVRGVACCNARAFETPLGSLTVDRDAERDALCSVPCMIVNDATHAQEHAVEVQLPFLQRALGDDMRIVPLNVGDCYPQEAGDVLRALWGGDETAIVISSDLSHYHPHEYARELDDATIADITGGAQAIRPRRACGAFPINGLLDVCDELGIRPVLLGRCTSGDEGGMPALADEPRGPMPDPDEAVVGYASFGVWTGGKSPAGAENADSESSHGDTSALPADAGPVLLSIARRALEDALGIDSSDTAHAAQSESESQHPNPAKPIKPDSLSARHRAWLHAPGASFVTLTEDGRLRGCIGTLTPHQSLEEDVAEHAVDAAFRDPRFPAVRPWEYPFLDVEVSVLGSPHPIDASSREAVERALTPGTDGLILGDGRHRATYLPQVWEQLPDPHDFVGQLLLKAGLPRDYWSDEMTAQTYRVTAFHDSGTATDRDASGSDNGERN